MSHTAPYIWRREIMGDNVGGTEEKGVPASRGLDDLPDDIEVLQDMLREVKTQLRKAQLELDVRQATLEMVKKDLGADPELPTNAEKAAMAGALRAEYGLCEILPVAGMAKSSCEYAGNAQAKGETEERAAARSSVSPLAWAFPAYSQLLLAMPATGRISQSPYSALSAPAIAAFSAFVGSSGSAPRSFFTISRVAWRTSSSSCAFLSCVFTSRSMSCSTSMSSGRSSSPLLAGTPFSSVPPTLSPIISLRHM